ncbi:MAG: UDP-glucose dehydrogenase family protein [Actinomycetota bacterium]
MRVAVVGAGYVGLTSAVCLAHLGHDVRCADIDADRVARLTKGEAPIHEAGLPELLAAGLASGRLRFVVGAADAAASAEAVLLCVQTPQGADGAADLSFVEQVAREIAPVLGTDAVVVNKSTVPVGTTRLVERVLSEAGVVHDGVAVASNPEFLREGQAIHDFLHPDRIVIGCDRPEAAGVLTELYAGLQAPVLVTDPASAEMIKYAANAFLATKVSFINAIANLCEAVDADVREVALGMGYDARIGFQFLKAGPGYGGSCFPKDVAALLHTSRSAGYAFELLAGVEEVNRAQRERIVDKIRRAVGGRLDDATVAAWGLTFKADTDDLRESPAIAICARLVEEGARVRAFDPAAGEQVLDRVPGIEICADAYAAAEGAAAVAVLTEWDEFRWLDFERVAGVMERAAIVDARNLLDPPAMRRLGFAYSAVGRR